MAELLLLYASQTETGRVRRIVELIAEGVAQEPEARLTLLRADRAGVDALLAAQGLLLVTPEHFGYMAGKLKDFFDRTFYPAEGRTVGLPYALVVSAGNDGRGTVDAVTRIATGYRWKPAVEPLILRQDPDAEAETRLRELGLTLAAGVALGAF